MATGSKQQLDRNRLAAIVLFLIVGGIFVRTFLHNYVSEPARLADRMAGELEKMRAAGSSTIPSGPGREYIMTGNEEAKQQIIRDVKRYSRDRHSLAIWGSLAVACISIIIVVSVGLPMLLERRA